MVGDDTRHGLFGGVGGVEIQDWAQEDPKIQNHEDMYWQEGS